MPCSSIWRHGGRGRHCRSVRMVKTSIPIRSPVSLSLNSLTRLLAEWSGLNFSRKYETMVWWPPCAAWCSGVISSWKEQTLMESFSHPSWKQVPGVTQPSCSPNFPHASLRPSFHPWRNCKHKQSMHRRSYFLVSVVCCINRCQWPQRYWI